MNKSDEMLPLIIQIETISIEKAIEYIDKTTSNELIENSYGNEQAYEAKIRQYQTKVIVEIRSNCRFEEIDKCAVQPFIFIDQKINF